MLPTCLLLIAPPRKVTDLEGLKMVLERLDRGENEINVKKSIYPTFSNLADTFKF